ncbi:MAG: beta-lactamase family protein [Thermoanaerobaculia bacterium]|nr:beta-lactamase family protein [Thermoanaerobaculia bacterium]
MSSQRMIRRISWLLVTIVVSVLAFRLFDYVLTWNVGWHSSSSTGEPPVESRAAPSWEAIEGSAMDLLLDAKRDLRAPAVSAALSLDGRTVWAGAVGFADLESRRPATLETRFRLGSTSKSITSVALGTVLGGGELDLDAPVGTYLPEVAEPLASVTTRQAMSHTAGIRNYGLCWCFPIWEQFNRRDFGRSVRPSLAVFEGDALLFQPGTGFSYTSYGTTTVGAVIESVSGKPFLEYLEEAVLRPLSMVHSGGDLPGEEVSGRASFYDVEKGRWRLAYPVNNSIKWPSGGLISTPSDMLALGREMLAPRLFDDGVRDLLITPQKLADGSDNPQGYALGWRVSNDAKLFDGSLQTQRITHHGVAVGSLSYFAIYPDEGLVVSVMANRSAQRVNQLARHAKGLVELFLGESRRQIATDES